MRQEALPTTWVFAIAGLTKHQSAAKSLLGFSSGLTLLIRRQNVSSAKIFLIEHLFGLDVQWISCHRKYFFVGRNFFGDLQSSTITRHLSCRHKKASMTQAHKIFLLIYIVQNFIAQPSFAQNDFVRTIYFATNSYRIDKTDFTTLDEIAKKCSADTSFYMKIFAFADTTGSQEYNDMLSKKRAVAVYEYLRSRFRLDSTNVYVTWLGKSAEGYDLHFPEAHIQQRCVDIWIRFNSKQHVTK